VKSKSILLDIGLLDPIKIIDIFKDNGYMVTFISSAPEAIKKVREKEIYIYDYRSLLSDENLRKTNNIDLKYVCESVLNDLNTWNMYDRRLLLRSSARNTRYVLKLVLASLAFFSDNRFDEYMLVSSPHCIEAWVFARVYELYMRRQIIYFNLSLFPWRVAMIKGAKDKLFVKHEELCVLNKYMSCEVDLMGRFKRMKLRAGVEAMPKYERERLRKNGDKYYSFYRDLKKNWNRIDLVINKLACYKRYKKVSQRLSDEKYFVMFLHFQPERTTVPDGGSFSEQLLAAKMIKNALPEGYDLIIKEHPATFTNVCDWKQRWPDYYDDFLSIGAKLADIEENTYDLIEKSKCCISITGTVLYEAVLRNIPVIYFGTGPLYPISTQGVHRYSNAMELQNFIFDVCSEKKFEINIEEIYDFVIKNTVPAKMGSDCDVYSITDQEVRFNAVTNYISFYAELLGKK